MSGASQARKAKRALKRVGVAVVDRVVIEGDALASAITAGANVIDLVGMHVAEALTRLDAAGGDIFGRCVVSIGDHPDYPGAVTIEAKVATLKGDPADPDPGCPIDHSLDNLDEDHETDAERDRRLGNEAARRVHDAGFSPEDFE